MTALSADRNTLTRDGRNIVRPVGANVAVYAGALLAFDATGNLIPGKTATGLRGAGRAAVSFNNVGGAAGAANITAERGCFRWANDGSITGAHVFGTAYIVDDQTVAATDGTGTRSPAGKIIDVDAAGVWVET